MMRLSVPDEPTRCWSVQVGSVTIRLRVFERLRPARSCSSAGEDISDLCARVAVTLLAQMSISGQELCQDRSDVDNLVRSGYESRILSSTCPTSTQMNTYGSDVAEIDVCV